MLSTNNVAKIKKIRRYNTISGDMPVNQNSQNNSSFSSQRSSLEIGEAKVRKIRTLLDRSNSETCNKQKFIETSLWVDDTLTQNQLETTFCSYDMSSNDGEFECRGGDDDDVIGETLPKLYVVNDYKGNLMYGDLEVRKGEFVYLICESEKYYFVENKDCKQGFVPRDICVDLIEVIFKMELKTLRKSNDLDKKVTSL